MRARAIIWRMSDTDCIYVDCLRPEQVDATLAFLRSSSVDNGARLVSIDYRVLDDEDKRDTLPAPQPEPDEARAEAVTLLPPEVA
jgi:hypothetical protein